MSHVKFTTIKRHDIVLPVEQVQLESIVMVSQTAYFVRPLYDKAWQWEISEAEFKTLTELLTAAPKPRKAKKS